MPNDTVPAAVIGLPSPRRGFLRDLLTLPLIGGGVTLIGNPTAAAEPITKDLLIGYSDWLLLERRILNMELFPNAEDQAAARHVFLSNRVTEAFHLPPGGGWQDLPKPSTRAALVLSAVGCDWRRS